MRDRSGRSHLGVRGRAAAVAFIALTLVAVVPVAVTPTLTAPSHGSLATSPGSRAPVRAMVPPAPAAIAPATSGPPVPGNWTTLSGSPTLPPARGGGGLVYDPTLPGYVLFGGAGTSGQALNDTWTLVRGTWTNLTASLAVAPSARWYAAFVWDTEDGYALLFGGRNGTALFNDTWTFNGTAWAPENLSVAPPPLSAGRIADDAADGYVVLSGGSTGNTTSPVALNETWTYAAGSWTNRTAQVVDGGADPRVVTNAAYDAADGVELLFGGNGDTGANCAAPGYTWTYLNGTYSNRSATLSIAPPGAFAARMMAYDPAYGGVVLYGGFEQAPCPLSNQTWLYRGGAWYNLTTSFGPGPLWNGQLATDTATQGVLLFSGRNAAGAVSAAWNFTPVLTVSAATNDSLGVGPLTVNLTASAVGAPPLAYAWTYTDGTPAGSGPNVTHTFASPGVYRPTVQVTDELGRNRSATVTIVVVAHLVTNVSAFPAVGDAPLTVTFTNRLTGGTSPYGYAWSFGDGGVGTTKDPSHTYVAPGRYDWSVNTTDALGDAAEANGTIVVNPPLAIAAFAVSPAIGVAPFTVYANVTPINGTGADAVTWSFGDSSAPESGPSVAHTYSLAGTFTGRVTIVDAAGGQVNESFNVTSVAPLSVGVTATPSAGAAPLEVGFAADLRGGQSPFDYAWTLGRGGASSTSASPSFLYATPGVYAVNVSVTDAAAEVAVGHVTITVVPPLVANLTQGTFAGVAPANLTLSVTTTGGYGPFTVQWTFGDGSGTAGGLAVSHVYLHPGSFPVHAEVTDAANDAYGASAIALVVAPLGVTLTPNASVIDLGASVSLTAVTSGGDAPFTASWSGLFPGCPSNTTALVVDCGGAETGRYNVTVTVRDALNEVRTSTTTVLVIAPNNPGAPSVSVWGSPIPYLAIGAGLVVLALLALLVRRGPRSRPPEGPEVVIEPPKGAPRPAAVPTKTGGRSP